ncbi:MAG: tRNA (N6-isopentenyl adenosine(37)-C2)-methylthiotransferase MiaB [Deltaproteobacteria bacterium]|nr:tRNA (N6-isopentenyl adenosine(37)-C2)-methylthiotransferase MiaB [Deltaproteobacteria bacterium]
MPQYYHITTMGCQMNKYDSNHIRQLLQNSGFLPADIPDNADLILINTCTVRAKAQQKAFSLLGRMVSLKKRRPDLILGITGCIAQQEGPDLIKRFPGLDLVLGTREIGRITEILETIKDDRKKVVATNIELKPISPVNYNGFFKGQVKSYISIMEGCNNFCSYCIVPYVRGREISCPPKEILKEAKNLISQGVKEITLLGQNVNSYSWGEKKEINFPMLLKTLSRLDGLLRIRFTTSHPKDLSDDLIHCFGELDNLCPHIHLPFQAGSNKVLKLMNRGYSRERYMELINRLREVKPDIAVTSDVMVGFPKETDEDFQMTLDLINKMEFDNLFSFKYSDRKGTLAEKMSGKIDKDEISFRLDVLQQVQKGITLKKNKTLEGKKVEILVEGDSKRGGQFTGRTGTNKIVNFNCNNNIIGQLVEVDIEYAFVNSLKGVLIGSDN